MYFNRNRIGCRARRRVRGAWAGTAGCVTAQLHLPFSHLFEDMHAVVSFSALSYSQLCALALHVVATDGQVDDKDDDGHDRTRAEAMHLSKCVGL